jgi:hypothetical protein
MSFAQVALASLALLISLISTARGADGAPSPEQLRRLYVGQWKLACFWTNDVKQLGPRPGESIGGYTGTAQISERDGVLVMELVSQAPDGKRWEKELALVAGPRRLALDLKHTRRRAGVTEYTRMDLVLSPDGTTLRGVDSWNNGLNANRANEAQLMQAQPPSIYFPWGVGGSSLCLKRLEAPPADAVASSATDKGPTILLEALDPDRLVAEADLKGALDEHAEWLKGLGYDVLREPAGSPPDLRGTLEVARFQASITGEEVYLDTMNNQPVKFQKGTIAMAAAFTIKDARGKRVLLNVSLTRGRDSATPNDNPQIRNTTRGPILLPPNMPQDYKVLLNLLPGQVAALPPKLRRSEHASRLEELLFKGE